MEQESISSCSNGFIFNFTIMPRISDGVMNLINAAKEKGMIFYGLGISISEITDCQVYEIIDRMWFYCKLPLFAYRSLSNASMQMTWIKQKYRIL